MKQKLSLVVGLIAVSAWLGGCTAKPPAVDEFTWYHPQGGEYLFAFDQGQCETQVLGAGQRMGTQLRGPFFVCMEQRGYALLDAQGRVMNAQNSMVEQGSTPTVSQQ